MKNIGNYRIAWLVPSVEVGAYFGPIIQACTKVFQDTVFYTGRVWPSFSLEDPGAAQIKVVGTTGFIESKEVELGYSQGFILASPGIATHLIQFRPDVVVASAFSLWTLIALLLKPLYRWKLIVVYDGFSPNTSFKVMGWRSIIRYAMAQAVDAFIANNNEAKRYLKEALKVEDEKICIHPYLVPDSKSLLQQPKTIEIDEKSKRPIFIYVGQVVSRKGIRALFEACSLLKEQGYSNYTLLIVGDGSQRQELEAFAEERELQNQIIWAGWVEYGQLGGYFQHADIFVFPTYEDVWGMVVLEAMAFGKPILCSKWAGAVEMIEHGNGGYVFDPHEPSKLAELMRRYIDQPDLIYEMGAVSRQIISQYTPATTAQVIADIAEALLTRKG